MLGIEHSPYYIALGSTQTHIVTTKNVTIYIYIYIYIYNQMNRSTKRFVF